MSMSIKHFSVAKTAKLLHRPRDRPIRCCNVTSHFCEQMHICMLYVEILRLRQFSVCIFNIYHRLIIQWMSFISWTGMGWECCEPFPHISNGDRMGAAKPRAHTRLWRQLIELVCYHSGTDSDQRKSAEILSKNADDASTPKIRSTICCLRRRLY